MNKKNLADIIALNGVVLGISTTIVGASYSQEISESYNKTFHYFFQLDKLFLE